MSISDTFEPHATFFSPNATPPQTFHQWPDLPAELKLEVLAKVLSSHNEPDWGNFVTADSHRVNLAKCLLPIIKTRNRELVLLAMDVYYKRNVFGIQVGLNDDRTEPAIGICYPRPASAKLIRRLRICGSCDAGMNLEDLVRMPELGWRWLLKPLRPLHFGPLNNRTVLKPHRYRSSAPDPEANTQWQLSFSNLKTLKMTFYLNDVMHLVGDRADRGECCNLSIARRMSLIGLVEEAEMLLKADSVSIVC
jgi:hypothetical protein